MARAEPFLVYKQPMRRIAALVLLGTLAVLLSACPPIQQSGSQRRTCLTDLECREGQKCNKSAEMVLGYCRDLQEQPAPTAPDAGSDAAPDAPPAPGDVSI